MLRTRSVLRSLAPLGDRVLVRRLPKQAQTASGIYLPDSASGKDPNEGKVVAVGPGERDMSGNLHPITNLKVDDSVLLPEYGGTKVKLDDNTDEEAAGELVLFRESDILGKFE